MGNSLHSYTLYFKDKELVKEISVNFYSGKRLISLFIGITARQQLKVDYHRIQNYSELEKLADHIENNLLLEFIYV
jgi:hypothetical protein